jgi:hypothetical protein
MEGFVSLLPFLDGETHFCLLYNPTPHPNSLAPGNLGTAEQRDTKTTSEDHDDRTTKRQRNDATAD